MFDLCSHCALLAVSSDLDLRPSPRPSSSPPSFFILCLETSQPPHSVRCRRRASIDLHYGKSIVSVSWSPAGVDPELNEHSIYLDDLCGTLSARLKEMVAKAAHVESPDWDELPPTFRKVGIAGRPTPSHISRTGESGSDVLCR